MFVVGIKACCHCSGKFRDDFATQQTVPSLSHIWSCNAEYFTMDGMPTNVADIIAQYLIKNETLLWYVQDDALVGLITCRFERIRKSAFQQSVAMVQSLRCQDVDMCRVDVPDPPKSMCLEFDVPGASGQGDPEEMTICCMNR